MGFSGASEIKKPPANAGEVGSMSGSRRFPGGGNDRVLPGGGNVHEILFMDRNTGIQVSAQRSPP